MDASRDHAQSTSGPVPEANLEAPPSAAEAVFREGDRVYLLDGTVARYAGSIYGGHAVSLAIDDGYDEWEEPVFGETLIVVPRVYAEPPVAHKHAEIAALEERVATLKAQAEAHETAMRERERQAKERVAAISKWEGLDTLEAFLAGRITHIVTGDDEGFGGLAIKDFGEALREGCRAYDRELRLVSLFGDSKGNLSWRINQYRDGSGSWESFVPCGSQEEAVAVARERFDRAVEAAREADKLDYRLGTILRGGKKLGFEIPPDVAARERAYRIDEVRRQMKSSEEYVARYRAQIAQIEAEASGLAAGSLDADRPTEPREKI